ncbi:lipoprotein N-acyltransferase Lnb domain-containing protein [Emticicia sp. 17c]|uniref:lipoprotein N-acyltransferase Lnb domain-containing protein n=1 Tax=Emticicia sp. 17c TaxID=3127704 RepID=UPI00301DC339
MKKYLSVLFFIFASYLSTAQTLSPYATVSLLTIAPGDELYSTFGHSGIRIKDPMQALDIVYNYGAFDFRTKGFYLKFLRGTLPYQISMNYFDDEIYVWSYQKRLVTEQVLNLSREQKQGVYNFLLNNYLPENRQYAYKFFYDNCSSRLRDVLTKVCSDSLRLQTNVHADSSYRQWIDKYARLNHKLWADFGMDLAIGTPSDALTGANGAMFLPDNLKDAFDKAQIKRNGSWQPLVYRKMDLNPHVLQGVVKEDEPVSPNMLFWSLFVAVSLLTFAQLKRNSANFIFDKIFFSVTGIAGWVIVFLWFFTNHGVTEYNLNIIWAYPLLFPIALYLKKDTSRQWLSKHFLAYGIIQLLLLLSWKFLPQEINYSLIPVVLILAIRSFFVWWRLRNKLRSF